MTESRVRRSRRKEEEDVFSSHFSVAVERGGSGVDAGKDAEVLGDYSRHAVFSAPRLL